MFFKIPLLSGSAHLEQLVIRETFVLNIQKITITHVFYYYY